MSHSHHKKYYEREDGYVYSVEELDAYRVSSDKRNRCVNFYVPLLKCQQYQDKQAFIANAPAMLREAFDHWGGKCYKELEDYTSCRDQYIKNALASPITNMYFRAPFYAASEQVSSQHEKSFTTSPLVL